MLRAVFLDLDGTIVDTNDSRWDEIKYGKQFFDPRIVPLTIFALKIIHFLNESKIDAWIVSDSAESYVSKMAAHLGFGKKYLSNCQKPNTQKFCSKFCSIFSISPNDNNFGKDFIFIGDTSLDIHMARRLGMPSILVDNLYKSQGFYKKSNMGSTYICRTPEDVIEVLKNPELKRLPLESSLGSTSSTLNFNVLQDGRRIIFKGLARQLRGAGDWISALYFYNKIHSENPDEDFIKKLAEKLSTWVGSVVNDLDNKYNWSIITWTPDKETTKPKNKMKNLVARVESKALITQIFKWKDDVDGSVRRISTEIDRTIFLDKYLYLDPDTKNLISGKDIIVIDDQYTTGATAKKISNELISAGARNVLFVALFYITDDVPPGIICPVCNLEVMIKTNKKKGNQFYSCAPRIYGNTVDGCGWTKNIEVQT